MRTFIIFCVLYAAVSARPEEKYTDRYDNVDLGDILANKKLLTAYINCILEKGKCSPDGKELKAHIREALENNCAKCTETQRSGSRRVIGHIINEEPEYWKQLTAKYDKDGKYAVKYESDLKIIKS